MMHNEIGISSKKLSRRLIAIEELNKANSEKQVLLDKIEQLEAEKQASVEKGIFLKSVDRFNEDGEIRISTDSRANIKPLLEENGDTCSQA